MGMNLHIWKVEYLAANNHNGYTYVVTRANCIQEAANTAAFALELPTKVTSIEYIASASLSEEVASDD